MAGRIWKNKKNIRHIARAAAILIWCAVGIFGGNPQAVWAAQEDSYLEDLRAQMDFTDLDGLTEEELFATRDKIQFSQVFETLLNGGGLTEGGKMFAAWLKDALFYEVSENRKLMAQVVLLAAGFSILKNFSEVFRLAYIAKLCYLLVYCVLGILLMQSFVNFSAIAEETLTKGIDFMRALVPTLSLALVFSTGAGTSAGFYQTAFLAIYLIQWVFLKFLMPGIRIYVVLQLLNYFFEEPKLANLTDLLKGAICFGMKAAGGIILGLNVVQGMIFPAKDRLVYGGIGKAASMIPGVGNVAGGVRDILLGSGLLIKNCVGVAALLILLAIGLLPMAKMGILAFYYRLAAAVTEPVADKRIAGCLKGMAEGGMLYVKLAGYSLTLFFLTIAITTTMSGIGVT